MCPSLFGKSAGATPDLIVFSEVQSLFVPQAGYFKWDQSMIMVSLALCLDLHPLHTKSSELYSNALHILVTYRQFWLGKIICFMRHCCHIWSEGWVCFPLSFPSSQVPIYPGSVFLGPLIIKPLCSQVPIFSGLLIPRALCFQVPI